MAHRLALLVIVLCSIVATNGFAAEKVTFAHGYSDLEDYAAAGKAAAQQALKGLDGKTPKLVLVNLIVVKTKGKQAKPDVAGVLEVFDKSIVFGSSNAAVIAPGGILGKGVAVLAFAGEIEVVMADAPLDAKGDVCGKAIGEKIKAAGIPKGDGRVLLLAGDCHHPKNNHIAQGVMAVLGDDLPIVGAAADGPKLVVFQGELKRKHAIGVLLAGAFECGFGMETGGKKDAEKMLKAAETAAGNAVKETKPELLLLFDCAGRRRSLLKAKVLDREYDIFKKAAGEAMLFGFYGQGEIGKPNRKEKSFGSGYYVSACSIRSK